MNESGQVGINQTSPGYALDVNGTGDFTGVVNVGTPVSASNAATKSYVDTAIAAVTSTISGTAGYIPVFTGANAIGNHDFPTGIYDVINGLRISGADTQNTLWQASGTLSIDTNGTNLNLGYGNGLYALTVQGSSGNVGIGTTNPGYPLQVAGEVAVIGTNGGFRVFSVKGDDTNSSPWYGLGLSSITYLDKYSGTQDAVQLAGYYGLSLQTAAGQIVMTSAGNVGIGTTNPTYKLDVNGGPIRITNSGGDLDDHFDVNGYEWREIFGGTGTGYGVWAGGMGFYSTTLNGNYSLIMSSNSYLNAPYGFSRPVVVGTPTASNRAATKSYVDTAVGSLHAVTAASSSPLYEGFRVRANDYLTNGGYLLFGKQPAVGGHGVIQSGDSSVYAPLAINPNGGNVGVGTTNPTFPLQVVNGGIGEVRVQGATMRKCH